MTEKPHVKSEDDRRLLLLFYEWQVLMEGWERLMDLPESRDNDRQACDLSRRADGVARRICGLRAYTRRGLRAKAQMVERLYRPEPLAAIWPDEPTGPQRLAHSLVNDVFQLQQSETMT